MAMCSCHLVAIWSSPFRLQLCGVPHQTMTFRSSIELLIPLDVDVLEIWVLPCGVGDNISSSRNRDTSITDIEKRDMITFLGQEMWGPLPLTFLGQEMLSCHVSCIVPKNPEHQNQGRRRKMLNFHEHPTWRNNNKCKDTKLKRATKSPTKTITHNISLLLFF